MAIYMVMGVTRLSQLTGYVHKVTEMLKQHLRILVDLRRYAGEKEVRYKAEKFITLLQPIEGISVSGFFEVNRRILIAISSYILTFVIILVEFKMNDLKI